MEWGSRLDFEIIAPGIAKLKERNVFAHDGRPCNFCTGRGLRRCSCAIERYFRENSIRLPGNRYGDICGDLDESRVWLMSSRGFLDDTRTGAWLFLVDDLAPLENSLHFEPAYD
jgi:hypothetical protein